jgi:hypothetical protein
MLDKMLASALRRPVRSPLGALLVLSAALAFGSPGAAAPQLSIQLSVFVHTDLPLGDVLWTGREFLHVTETVGEIWASDASGTNLRRFIALPREVEEMRCRVSPATHGWRARDIYCHSPGNVIYRVAPDGGSYTVFARLPESKRSDGALAFDTVGTFGYALLAATGASGDGPGGRLFTIRPNRRVRLVGRYGGPGGAENLAVAPRRFGNAGGNALLSIDYVGHEGKLLAVNRRGHVTTLARHLGDGINPIAVIGSAGEPSGAPSAGFYVTDTISTNVLFAPASQFREYRGGVIVGTETAADFWIVRPQGSRFRVIRLETNLTAPKYNFEGAAWVGS